MKDIDFLHAILADIGEPEVAGLCVETETPWIAQAGGPDFGPYIGAADEWVVSGNGIRLAVVVMIDIDANHFAEEQLHVLSVAVRVTVRAGIAHREIKVAVRTEGDAAATVIAGEAGNLDEAAGGFAGIMKKIGGHCLFHEDGCNTVLLEGLVFQVVLPVFFELRMERDTEQAVRTGFAVSFGYLVGEEGLLFVMVGFLNQPDKADLVCDQRCVRLTGNGPEAGEAGFDAVDARRGKLLVEEGSDFAGAANFGMSEGVALSLATALSGWRRETRNSIRSLNSWRVNPD